MAKSRSRLDQPGGGKISVGPEERAWFKQQRVAKGFNQGALARRVGVSQGTISNLESGAHPQITKVVYAKLRQTLGEFEPSLNSQVLVQDIIRELPRVPESNLKAIYDLARALASSPKK